MLIAMFLLQNIKNAVPLGVYSRQYSILLFILLSLSLLHFILSLFLLAPRAATQPCVLLYRCFNILHWRRRERANKKKPRDKGFTQSKFGDEYWRLQYTFIILHHKHSYISAETSFKNLKSAVI
ncbi:hypothetical protein GGI43DRAFT_510 [Trichoderma evansii]